MYICLAFCWLTGKDKDKNLKNSDDSLNNTGLGR